MTKTRHLLRHHRARNRLQSDERERGMQMPSLRGTWMSTTGNKTMGFCAGIWGECVGEGQLRPHSGLAQIWIEDYFWVERNKVKSTSQAEETFEITEINFCTSKTQICAQEQRKTEGCPCRALSAADKDEERKLLILCPGTVRPGKKKCGKEERIHNKHKEESTEREVFTRSAERRSYTVI